jgi:uncharacterized protein YraI
MPSGQIKSWIRNAALVAAIAMPLAAAAQQAVVSGGNLRAGPDRTYPLVAQLAPGTPATVMGCISGYTWCDVVVPGGLRGWLYGGRLGYAYQGAPVPLLGIGAAIGVPIITFSLDSYWNNYYRDRSWYSQPRWWGGRRPLPPVPGWRPPPSAMPAWRPRTPPAHWRPPAVRPEMVHPVRPSVARPEVMHPGRPAVARPEVVRPARPPAARPQQAPDRRSPERRNDHQDNRR